MSKLPVTTDVVTYRYCTEASNQKSKYAYRKIFFYKKSTGYVILQTLVPLTCTWISNQFCPSQAFPAEKV